MSERTALVSVAVRPAGSDRWRWLGLAALLLAEAMNLLDATIVQVAAPVIHTELSGAAADIQWFSAAYTLPFALLLITGGRLGDILGRRRLFRLGVVGFALASLACALAPSAGLLIGARVVQGAAAAVIIPQTFGLIRAMFHRHNELARALGWIGPVMGLAAICGPVLGGVLTHADLLGSSWRAAFLVNLPLAGAVLAVAPLLCEDRAPRRPRSDPVGTALAALGTGLVVYPLINAPVAAGPVWTWLGLGGGLAVLILFAAHQRRSTRLGRDPLVEPSLFGNLGFPSALAASILFFATLNGLMLVTVLYLQLGRGADPRTAGLSMLPWSAGMAISSWVAGAHLVPRYGPRVMYAGLAVLLSGVLAAIATFPAAGATGQPGPLLGALGVGGLGIGLFTAPFFTTALARVRPQETGSAAGLLNAVQQLGATLGVALLGSVFLRTAAATPPAETGSAALDAVRRAYWVAAGLLATTGVAAALMIEPRRREPRHLEPRHLEPRRAPDRRDPNRRHPA